MSDMDTIRTGYKTIVATQKQVEKIVKTTYRGYEKRLKRVAAKIKKLERQTPTASAEAECDLLAEEVELVEDCCHAWDELLSFDPLSENIGHFITEIRAAEKALAKFDDKKG